MMVLSEGRLKEEIKTIKVLMDTSRKGIRTLLENNEVNEIVLESFKDALAIYNKRNK